jgi:hypothetical protein
MPQNWWEAFPEILPSPAARPYPLPGPGGVMPARAMGPGQASPYGTPSPDQAPVGPFDPSYFSDDGSGIDQFGNDYADQAGPPDSGQASFAGGDAAPGLDRDAVMQHAIAAIQSGADPNTVRARLDQMGQGEQEPASPFSGLIPKGEPAMGGSLPLSMQMRPAFDDQGGFAPRGTGTSLALDPLGRLPPRLDPRLAPQKSDGLQKASLQTAGTDAAPTTFFTYGLPSYPFPRDERGVAPRPVPGRGATRRFDPYSEANLALGQNEQYRADILNAAHFYHLTPHVIAGLAGAETNPNQWNRAALNRKSHAAGLMQFLPGTWTDLAQRRGTYLNSVAARLGYLDRQGHLIPARTAQFLALRNDPTTSIWAAADYASHNLGVLRSQGYIRNESPAALARYAYIAHHEGAVGAQRFLRGDPAANEGKFYSNVPPAEQAQYLAANNNDRSRAYLDFYTHYVDGKVDVTRYMRNRAGIAAPPTRSLLR